MAVQETVTGSKSLPYPRPVSDQDYAPLYEGFQQRRLIVQECDRCGKVRYPPGPMCPSCHCLEFRQHSCSGAGQLFSWTVHYYPPIPPFQTPHVLVLVEMEEGFRFLAGLKGFAADDLRVDLNMRLDFEEVEPGYMLPIFRVGGER